MGIEVLLTESKRFPDSTAYVRLLADVRGQNVAVVGDTLPDANLVELLLMQAALRRNGAAYITSIIPYYAYARQDRVFEEGETVSAKDIAKLIKMTADRVILIDLHKESILKFFGTSAVSATCLPEITDWLKNESIDLIIAPDKGALPRCAYVATILGIEINHFEKTRLSGTEVQMAPKKLNVAGKRVAILDDMMVSGGTIKTAATDLKAQGAAHVVAICTHGVFLGDSLSRLRQSGCDEVVATNTLPNDAAKISCIPAIMRALGRT
jgi:ribose-phosphate pyrophosphokinase